MISARLASARWPKSAIVSWNCCFPEAGGPCGEGSTGSGRCIIPKPSSAADLAGDGVSAEDGPDAEPEAGRIGLGEASIEASPNPGCGACSSVHIGGANWL